MLWVISGLVVANYLQTDYYHAPYLELVGDIYEKPPLFVPSDTNLINGKSNLNCGSTTNASLCLEGDNYPRYKFETRKTHRLRLINAGATSTQKFSIDNHEMIVIANDYVPINPYTTNVVTLGAGQRSDVLVNATGNADDAVWMRSVLDKSCFPGQINQATALAAVYYTEADKTMKPATNGTTLASGQCSNVWTLILCPQLGRIANVLQDPLAQTVPLFAIELPTVPAVTQTLDIRNSVNETGFLEFLVNNSSFRADYKYAFLPVPLISHTLNLKQ